MAGGEKAKSSGEYGEQIVKNILELMGWNNANSGVTVPCVHKEKHKKENSKEPQKHGIDYVYTYKSQLRDATKQDVLVKVTIAFPDYNSFEHREAVLMAKSSFENADFVNSIEVITYKPDFRDEVI